jgi:hypothetical protein
LIAIFENLPRVASNIIFAILGIGSIVLNFVLINGGDFGIFLTFDNDGTHFNTQFLNELFMKPYFHFGAYLWGVVLCLAYVRYAREKSGLIPADVANNSLSSRAFTFIRSNHVARYVLYVFAFTLTSLTFFSLHAYLVDNSAWSKSTQAAYGSMAYPGFVIGSSIFLMSAVLGRAEFVRFFLGGDAWILFKNIGYGLYLFSPVYALLYFQSMSISQHLDYQMMFYNFCGIFVFSLLLVNLFFPLIHGPFTAIFNLEHYVKTTANAITFHNGFNIEHYKVKGEGEEPLIEGGGGNYLPQIGQQNNINQTNSRLMENSTTMFDMSNSKQQ